MEKTSSRETSPFHRGLTRIEICGGIASGKTSFANMFRGTNATPVFERFRANPFWRQFYVDPAKYSFETEVVFSLQHYHEIKLRRKNRSVLICDFSIIQDLAYATVTLKAAEWKAWKTIHEQIRAELGPPRLIVHLTCDAETELQRIRTRGRKEEKGITLTYLNSLNVAISKQVDQMAGQCAVLEVDSVKENFVRGFRTKADLRGAVGDILSRKSGKY